MKITHIEPVLLEIPYDHGAPKPRLGTGVVRESMDACYVRVDTDQGLSGWGECFGFACCPITHHIIKTFIAPLMVGRECDDIASLMHDMHRRVQNMGRNSPLIFALSGIDIALWDVAGQAKGLPVHRLLGSTGGKTRVEAYASLLRLDTPENVRKVCNVARGRGYRHVKLHERTVEATAAAREALGDGFPLMLDTNCTWTVQQAHDMAARLEPFDLVWLEEPLFPPDDYNALAALRSAASMPIAAGENLGNLLDAHRMIDAGAVDVIQPDPIKMGGITECWKALQLAHVRGVQAEPHSPYYGPGLIAALHMIGAMREECLVEYYFADLKEWPLGEMSVPQNGALLIPDAPGLGITVDEKVVARYRVA
jgi:D-galactarolactone cycloisomerase